MFFCKNDGQKLYIKTQDQEQLKYYCKLCNTEYDVDELSDSKQNLCIYKQDYTKNNTHKTYVNDIIFQDPTLPRLGNLKCINKKCPTNTEGASKEVVFIKLEDMTYLYCCTKCKTQWTNSFTRTA